ncbi:MAG: hypothetical protein LBU32_30960 [Clostridiales bacterium]|jgi:hypothetical protein|nr:hypothetical protein [Clostridiales bacterium]
MNGNINNLGFENETWSPARVKELTMRKISKNDVAECRRARHRVPRRLAMAAVTAIMTLTFATAALAFTGVINISLLGELSRSRDVPPEASELVQTTNSTAQVETAFGKAKFTVLETLWDGETLFVACEIAPPDAQTLLVSSTELCNIDETLPMSAYYYNFEIDDSPTFADYMRENGYAKMLYAGVSLWNADTNGSLGGGGYHCDLVDGKLIYYIEIQGNYTQLLYDDKVTLNCEVAEPGKSEYQPSDFVRTIVPVKYASAPSVAEQL